LLARSNQLRAISLRRAESGSLPYLEFGAGAGLSSGKPCRRAAPAFKRKNAPGVCSRNLGPRAVHHWRSRLSVIRHGLGIRVSHVAHFSGAIADEFHDCLHFGGILLLLVSSLYAK
jgi:hypothetical protein